MIAVSLFDYTGESLAPWADAGYECHIVDTQHPSDDSLRMDGMRCHNWDLSTLPYGEMLNFMENDDVAFLSCFPPCTDTSVSGAKHMKNKGLRRLARSIEYFATCTEAANILGCPFYIENPRSTIATYWRSADVRFNPCDYSGYADNPESEDYTKETHLWHGNVFVMPDRKRRDDMFDMLEMPDQKYIHHQSPGPERANIRSRTPSGWAKACFMANQ
jgi:hypothetical protein